MVDARSVFAIIPAYNEEGTIGAVVSSALPYVSGVVVVNDGSTDGTADAARENGALVIDNSRNAGYARSIEEGFLFLASKGGVYAAVTMDADGQHEADSLADVLGPIILGRSDIVVGIRPKMARVSEGLLALYTRRKYGLIDPLCGLKAYRMDIFHDVGHFDRIGSVGAEMAVRAIKKGYRLSQVRIAIRDREDRPRFGRALMANYKIMRAFFKLLSI